MRASDAGSRSGEAISTLTSRILHPPAWQQNRRFAENCVTCGRRNVMYVLAQQTLGFGHWALAFSALGFRLSGLGCRPRSWPVSPRSGNQFEVGPIAESLGIREKCVKKKAWNGSPEKTMGILHSLFCPPRCCESIPSPSDRFSRAAPGCSESRARSTRLCRGWPWSWLDTRPVRSPEKAQFNCLRPGMQQL